MKLSDLRKRLRRIDPKRKKRSVKYADIVKSKLETRTIPNVIVCEWCGEWTRMGPKQPYVRLKKGICAECDARKQICVVCGKTFVPAAGLAYVPNTCAPCSSYL